MRWLIVITFIAYEEVCLGGINSGGALTTVGSYKNTGAIGQPFDTGEHRVGTMTSYNGVLEVIFTSRDAEYIDSDNDGVPDFWEAEHGTDPHGNDANEDTDGDGLSNFQEYIAGTDPDDASSTFLVGTTSANNNFPTFFQSVVGRSYEIFSSRDLTSWTLETTIVGNGGEKSFTYDAESDADPAPYFIRIVVIY